MTTDNETAVRAACDSLLAVVYYVDNGLCSICHGHWPNEHREHCQGKRLSDVLASVAPAPASRVDVLDEESGAEVRGILAGTVETGRPATPPREIPEAPANPAPVFQALRDAGGSDWDEVADPQSHLDELRGEVPASPAQRHDFRQGDRYSCSACGVRWSVERESEHCPGNTPASPAACPLCMAQARLAALERERDALLLQLPDGMKHCTILFKECTMGHGWLTATNWVQHGCPTCERDALRAALAK